MIVEDTIIYQQLDIFLLIRSAVNTISFSSLENKQLSGNAWKRGWSIVCSVAHTALFLGIYTIDQPRFQVNIPPSRWYIAPTFHIWSVPVGYEELAGGFQPIRNGEIFWMNN